MHLRFVGLGRGSGLKGPITLDPLTEITDIIHDPWIGGVVWYCFARASSSKVIHRKSFKVYGQLF